MIQHSVILKWNDSVPPGHADACVDARVIIVATFDDVDGWRHYDEHPLHNEIRTKFFKPYVATRASAQFGF